MNLKLISAAAITGALLLGAAPAEARHIAGYEIDYLYDSGSYNQQDVIRIFGPHGMEHIQVTCAPFDWKSSGPNTVNWVDSIARAWCF